MIDIRHHRTAGLPGAPVVILGPSPGTTPQLWDPQVRVLARRWRVVAFDLPGQFDGRPLLPRITAPTVVLAGADDPATPVAAAEELAAATGADLIVLPDSAHLTTVEQSDLATRHIAEHLERHLR